MPPISYATYHVCDVTATYDVWRVQTYEREAIDKHLNHQAQAQQLKDPERRSTHTHSDPFKACERFSATSLTPNLALKRFVDEFLEVALFALLPTCTLVYFVPVHRIRV